MHKKPLLIVKKCFLLKNEFQKWHLHDLKPKICCMRNVRFKVRDCMRNAPFEVCDCIRNALFEVCYCMKKVQFEVQLHEKCAVRNTIILMLKIVLRTAHWSYSRTLNRTFFMQSRTSNQRCPLAQKFWAYSDFWVFWKSLRKILRNSEWFWSKLGKGHKLE